MNNKRVTIYDIAKELGMSASYVSRALNDHPLVSEKIRSRVKKKAIELNYKHNLQAANLRQGSSKTIGVVVPHINQSFFSDAIAGIEEVCFDNNHSLVICQSHESYKHECLAVETLIFQNVDCILISVSAETKQYGHLEAVKKHNIELIQFDRCVEEYDSYKILNDNKEASSKAVKTLIDQGYKKIAFIGGPEHLTIFRNRKEGYLKAIKNAGLTIPYNYIIENALSKEQAYQIAKELLKSKNPPDAFFTVSDHQSLAVLEVANRLKIQVPEKLGIFGFANETFSAIIRPSLSSVDQKSKEMGKRTAQMYFNNVLGKTKRSTTYKKEIIQSEIIIRDSSKRK